MTDWIKNLKVGDEVAVRLPHGWRDRGKVVCLQVTHCTQKFVECATVKFRRRDGLEVGSKPDCVRYGHAMEGPWAVWSERNERIQIGARLRDEFFTLGAKGLDRPLDQLRRIVQILDEPKGEAK